MTMTYMQRAAMKVRAKALVADARVLRLEADRELRKGRAALGTNRPHEHHYEAYQLYYGRRMHVVGRASRSLHLARACLLGRPYDQVEQVVHNAPDWHQVLMYVRIYGQLGTLEGRNKISVWLEDANIGANLRPHW